MFTTFFALLKERGLQVSIHEWLTLLQALDKGICGPSLTEFYYLCRCILVKSETDFDTFDLIFAEYFKGIKVIPEIPEEVWDWLDKEIAEKAVDPALDKLKRKDFEELRRLFEERLAEQKEEHHGGNYWVGTGGTSPFGHGGYHPQGIRVGGKGRHGRALQVAGERHFKDFRRDHILDNRQFQMAFRRLRQYSSRVDAARSELDIDQTVDKTCENAGHLKLVFEKPRQNTIKLLLLFDSDGSMLRYSRLCSELFHAVSKSMHFKDVKTWYFHNCIYEHLYTDPYCIRERWIDTEWAFRNLGSDYKLIIVGDASMAPSELSSRGGNNYVGLYNQIPGIDWLKELTRHYPKHIWLNPIPRTKWPYAFGAYTIKKIEDIFPMYELTTDGLEAGIKKLLAYR